MLRMILADDEPIITRGIRKLVDWERLGISIVGEYENGSSAMEYILSQQPDLALLDISMPGMTGTEILKSIRKMELSTKVIFISGFQDFEYAKDAITYGAVDYLLKPVIREQLLKALEKAVGLSGKKDSEQYQFKDFTLNGISDEENNGNYYNEELEKTTYLPVLTEILFDGKENEQEMKLIKFSFKSYLEEYLAEHKLGILFEKDDHPVIIFKGIQKEEVKNILYGLWEESRSIIGKKTAFILGKCVESMNEIPIEYSKCMDLCKYLFFEDQISVPILSTEEPVFYKKMKMEDMTVAREQMLDAIIVQELDAFERCFEHFSRVLTVLSEGRKEDACYYFCSTIRFVEDKMRAMNLEGRNPDVKELLEKGRKCQNFRMMKSIFREYLESYPALMMSVMKKNEKKDIVRAKEYIEEHYRENLTLEVLAGEVYMNPYYFSSFFKKNAGMNFKDYVNKVRIEHAVSLLVSTNMKTYEISAEVGFRDVRSFTEVFSRTYGETPNCYKKRVLAGEKYKKI